MIESGNFNNKEVIRNILLENGYPITLEAQNYITTSANFRGGDNKGSVAIYFNDDKVVDFVTSSHYKIDEFLRIVTNSETDEKLKQYFEKNNIVIKVDNSPKIKQTKIFSDELLTKLVPIYDYWTNRGIDEKILKDTKSGVFSGNGVMKNRWVIPIFNSKNQIIGLTGRDLSNKSPIKWIHRGSRNLWVWPAAINHRIIKEKSKVILVESPGDLYSLASCGIYNSLCLFGTELNLSILNFLLKLNLDTIYISTNDDSMKNNGNAGNNAALKIRKKLNKYFNHNQVKILMVKGANDWNDLLLQENGKEKIKEQLKELL